MNSSVYAICQSRKLEIRCSPEVRISKSGSGQSAVYSRALKIGLGDLLRHEAAVPRVPRQALRRPHQLRAAAVRDEQVEPEPVVVLGLGHHAVDRARGRWGQPVQISQ